MEKVQLIITHSQALRLSEYLIESKTGFFILPKGNGRWCLEPQCASMIEALKLGMALKEMRIEPENLPLPVPKEVLREKRQAGRATRKVTETDHLTSFPVEIDLSQPISINPESPSSHSAEPETSGNEGFLFEMNGSTHPLS
ncbi:MAG: hypothetical protein N2110_09670 [Flavobacteriales bacterium]|nr:hypothetical protein [Flavobacteriales bacterium]MCX7769270.1 hypothetical protein [Flavobacteriales bacterium]MDW8409985.1 hypothetical protein [Flavobacteriales bacterium]